MVLLVSVTGRFDYIAVFSLSVDFCETFYSCVRVKLQPVAYRSESSILSVLMQAFGHPKVLIHAYTTLILNNQRFFLVQHS